MRRRLFIALVLLVGLPIAGLTALAFKVAKDEGEMAAMQWRTLLEARLQDLANSITTQTETIEREALRAVEATPRTTDELRALVRRSPLVAQAFLLDESGALRFPPDDQTTSKSERAFVGRTQLIWERKAILYAPPRAEMPGVPKTKNAANIAPEPARGRRSPAEQMVQRSSAEPVAVQQSSLQQSSFQQAQARPRASGGRGSGAGDDLLDLAKGRDAGWIAWYWQEGLHLLLWRRFQAASGRMGVVGVEVDRVAALARIIGRLPEPANLDGRIILQNGRGDAIAQWGPFEPDEAAVPAAWVGLAPPWDAWRLVYHSSPTGRAGFTAGSVRWSLGLGLGALTLSLLVLAVYFYRESDREMRGAAQRVTFVTQVSHELKTPLTNIRLYAELLERDLDDEAERPRQRVATIVSEAQRLSRLISNILTFSRQRRGKLTVTPRTVELDRLVEGMVEQFRPALVSVGLELEVETNAPEPTSADPDTVDQIVANLLSNVEKYAASGGWVGITTRQDVDTSYVTVRDRGPGISSEHRERVFQSFYRISDRLSDGVTGTGIGLALSAELAKLNGGRLRLVPSDEGASFELSLPRARP